MGNREKIYFITGAAKILKCQKAWHLNKSYKQKTIGEKVSILKKRQRKEKLSYLSLLSLNI